MNQEEDRVKQEVADFRHQLGSISNLQAHCVQLNYPVCEETRGILEKAGYTVECTDGCRHTSITWE